MLSRLKYIYDELLKGNIMVLDLDIKKFLSDTCMYFYTKKDKLVNEEVESLKYLIMICNVTYNRTDSSVLPIEDGVYDLLLETYKRYDSNFQVGSAVVTFNSTNENLNESNDNQVIHPFIILPDIEKDEISQDFENKIWSFTDPLDEFKYLDKYKKNNYTELDMNISKRSHNTSHHHPDLVGTLDKCKFIMNADAVEKDVFDKDNVKILERDFFMEHIKKGIITPDQELEMVLELKYDGISVEADCTDEVISARTRGDTGIGLASDITPMLKGYSFPRNEAFKNKEIGVKFEAIITKSDLQRFNQERGYNYANCRTAIVGLFGASDANLYRDYITLVPLALDRKDIPEISDRMEEIELLNKIYQTHGEPLRYVYIKGNYQVCLYLIKKFAEEAKYAREYLNFMFDGIVVSYLDEGIRAALGRENYINKYSMAVKFDPLSKLTTFLGYSFEVGQSGVITPMIHYVPVEFFGTIHPKSTGSSYGRFMELGLKLGDVIEVTYTNDVMPYVTVCDCESNNQNKNKIIPFPTNCPVCGSEIKISDSGKSAYCININCKARRISRAVNMLQKLNIKGFADSTIETLNVYNFNELLSMTEESMQILGPTNASNLFNALREFKLTPIEDYKILGSIGFTGIASQKCKLILSQMTLRDLHNMMYTDEGRITFTNTLSCVNGIGPSVIKTIIEEYSMYAKDIEYILDNMIIIDSISNNKPTLKQIRFTGCRDINLEKQLQSLGYDADGSAGVTKKTDILLVPYKGFNSTKTSKVSEDCMIVSIQEFIADMNKYLM